MTLFNVTTADDTRVLNDETVNNKLAPTIASEHQLQKLQTKCRSRCPVECDARNYYLRFLTTEAWPLKPRMEIRIQAATQEIRVTHFPAVTLMQMLALVLYSASFWFCFCPATLLLSNRFTRLCGDPEESSSVRPEGSARYSETGETEMQVDPEKRRQIQRRWRHAMSQVLQEQQTDCRDPDTVTAGTSTSVSGQDARDAVNPQDTDGACDEFSGRDSRVTRSHSLQRDLGEVDEAL